MSKYVTDLAKVAEDLKEGGFPVSAEVCKEAADRMRRLEIYIIEMHKEFFPNRVPRG